jgi:hypothetical protein
MLCSLVYSRLHYNTTRRQIPPSKPQTSQHYNFLSAAVTALEFLFNLLAPEFYI